jgi:hypothetical protein
VNTTKRSMRILPLFSRAALLTAALAAGPALLGAATGGNLNTIAQARAETHEGGSHSAGGERTGGSGGAHSGGYGSGHDTGHEHESGDDGDHGSQHGAKGKGGPQYRGGRQELPRGEGDLLDNKVLQGDEEAEGGHEGGATHEEGQHDSNRQKGGGHGAPGEDSDAKGPRFGGGRGDETHGGRPVWAQEGIPEVELGRLNVVRSPEHVLQRALTESLASVTDGMVSFYNQPLPAIIEQLRTNYDNVVRIDSPLQNLALYQDLLAHTGNLNESGLASVGVAVTPANRNDLAALLLGSASDKNLTVSDDTVKAVSIMLGVDSQLTATDVGEIAAKANTVRDAILIGHGE